MIIPARPLNAKTIISPHPGNSIATGRLLNSMFMVSGISTLLQVFFGTRLPIIQSGSYVYFAVAQGLMASFPCQDSYMTEDGKNVTYDPNWEDRVALLQGNLMLASMTQFRDRGMTSILVSVYPFQFVFGGFGLAGLLLKVIGPITITIVISVIGLSLIDVAVYSASQHWGISLGMVVLITILSEYLKNVKVPIPVYRRGQKVTNGIPMENGANGDANHEEEDEYMRIRRGLKYPVDKNPSIPMSIILGFQQYLIMFGPTFAIPVILAPNLCIKGNSIATGRLLNSMFMVSGISTLLQVFFGTRLPIIQSGSYVYFAVAQGLMASFPCQDSYMTEDGKNVTYDPNWEDRVALLQGNLMLASMTQFVFGGFGLAGLLLKVIGPITITIVISVIGLSLIDVAVYSASQHWGISLGMVVLITILSEYLKNVKVPIPVYRRGQGCGVTRINLFSTMSIIFSITIMWLICGILTATNVFKEGNPASTRGLSEKLAEASWFYVPYPGQFGMPKASLGGFIGMFAGVIAGIIESLGDYYACAKLAGAPPPPKYAINRGILMEGLGCFIAGLAGPGIGVTSYSENVGAISLTKVGSKTVIACSGIFMLVIACIGKVGVLFSSLPEPIIGGMYIVMFGIIGAVGISNLQFVDLTSSRNIFIIGLSLYLGLAVPSWTNDELSKAENALQTGNSEFDTLLAVVLSSGMIVGGTIACFLDNTLPGTDEERGISSYRLATKAEGNKELKRKIYAEPLMEMLAKRFPILRKLPFVCSDEE
eukprot:sb/3462326/